MKPPQQDAVDEALSILMENVNKENDAQFVFTESPAMLVPLSSLPDNVEALKLAKLHINTALDALISSMQHRRNLAASIHKLPIEIMVMIFAAYTESSSLSDTPSLLDLTTVNKLWRNAIVHSPQLWTVLESDFTPKIAKLVLQRSKNLPLSLIWNTVNCDEDEAKELKELLDVMAQNSTRLKSIKMMATECWKPNRYIRRLLESNMPHLERLEVKTVWDPEVSGERLDNITLWDGPSLRKIALDAISLSSWSSPRLSGLFALDLTKPCQPPSIQELWNILYNSPQLESLRLCGLGRYSSWERPEVETITLLRLEEIFLEDLAGPYLSAMLTSAYAPSSSNVHIQSNLYGDSSAKVLEDVFAPGNMALTALLGLEDSESPSSEVPSGITIVFESFKVRITKSGGAERRKIELNFGTDLFSRDVALLGQFFRALSQVPPIILEIEIAAPTEESVAVDLSAWSSSLCSLSVHRPGFCRSALQQLAGRMEDATTAKLVWVCPNLTSMELCYMHPGEDVEELDGAALESLIGARWSGGAGGQLSKFAIHCEEERYPSIWSRVESLQQSIPCLSLVRE